MLEKLLVDKRSANVKQHSSPFTIEQFFADFIPGSLNACLLHNQTCVRSKVHRLHGFSSATIMAITVEGKTFHAARLTIRRTMPVIYALHT
jgi:hypothetical protein